MPLFLLTAMNPPTPDPFQEFCPNQMFTLSELNFIRILIKNYRSIYHFTILGQTSLGSVRTPCIENLTEERALVG